MKLYLSASSDKGRGVGKGGDAFIVLNLSHQGTAEYRIHYTDDGHLEIYNAMEGFLIYTTRPKESIEDCIISSCKNKSVLFRVHCEEHTRGQ